MGAVSKNVMQEPISTRPWARDFEIDPGGIESGWLQSSWNHPTQFWSALFRRYTGSGAVAPKSVFGDRYALYHDAVTRHLGQDRAAVRWYQRGRGWQELSYEELNARCRDLSRAWTDAGVAAGDVVAVVWPFGVDFVVSVLTGLRLGACVSIMPPTARGYVGRRLANLSPDHIATGPLYRDMLAELAALLLPTEPAGGPSAPGGGPSAPGDRSHTYSSGEPCALLFSPLREAHDMPWPVSCDDAYLRALRDGLLVFGLGAGEHFAAPGFPALQYQPSLLLAVLLAGGTYVHVPMSALSHAPELLMDRPLCTLGVGAEVRDLLLAAGLDREPPWRHWFRSPEDAGEGTAWQAFVTAYKLDEVPASNVLVEAAAGGSLLAARAPTSTERVRALMNVRPAAGVPWVLLDSNQSGQEAAGDVGIYAYGAPDEPSLSHALIARFRGSEYIYMGTPQGRRRGWLYPGDEVIAAVEELPCVDAASVVTVPSGAAFDARFVLLVFTGYDGRGPASRARAQDIERAIAAQVGPRFSPDRIELIPLYARRGKGGAVDHGWCRQQYHAGSLYRKARMPLFQHLTGLRRSVRDNTAAPQ